MGIFVNAIAKPFGNVLPIALHTPSYFVKTGLHVAKPVDQFIPDTDLCQLHIHNLTAVQINRACQFINRITGIGIRLLCVPDSFGLFLLSGGQLGVPLEVIPRAICQFLNKALGLTNSFWVYVIPGAISCYNMLVIRTYMNNSIPNSLVESAQIDGAGYTTIFVKIISPLCKPVYATVALFCAVGQWNSWFDAMLYNRMSDKYTTLQYELMKLLSSVTNQGTSAEAMKNAAGAVTPTSVRAAATILTMLPIVCLYPFLQKYFVQGLTLGSVKE